MLKLKEIIGQLHETTYNAIENKLIKTKADNFLQLLRAYRIDKADDKDILKNIGIVPNSFYVLKSRLFDKIQDELAVDFDLSNDDVFSQLALVHNVCYTVSNETAIAVLLRLEKSLLKYDMHGELLIVYSALKKLHYNTETYFHYSQLHNKHVAFWLSLEKAEDILSDFNSLFEKYEFSKSREDISKLQFLRSEIQNHSALNTSKQLIVIKNIMDIQLYLFCDILQVNGPDIVELLKETANHIEQLSNSLRQKKWETVLDYLSFEFYNKIGQSVKAKEFYDKTDQVRGNLLLFSSVALVSKFLMTKIEFLAARNEIRNIESEETELLSNDNLFSKIHLGLYQAMVFYYSNSIKKGTQILNELLGLFTFKDNFHIVMEIKFTLAFFYVKLDNADLAESLTTSILRKIKAEKLTQYQNALDLIKYFNTYYSATDSKTKTKRQESLLLFGARNTGENKLLRHLQNELKAN